MLLKDKSWLNTDSIWNWRQKIDLQKHGIGAKNSDWDVSQLFHTNNTLCAAKQEIVESSLIPAFPFSIDFNWVKNVFTLALCEAALACRTFARLSKCSFLASPSFLWLRSRNSSSWSFNFSAAREQERKSFKYSQLLLKGAYMLTLLHAT